MAADTFLPDPSLNSPTPRAGLYSAPSKLQKGQSLRMRPADILDNADPPSPLSASLEPDRLRRPSKMSLFSLFTRSKADPQRAPRELDGSNAHSPDRVRTAHAATRPASIASAKSSATKSIRIRPKTSESPRVPPSQAQERKAGSFEPPPLFQAYPQAMKEGVIEVSSISVDTLNKAKMKNIGPLGLLSEKPAGDRSSVETRRTSALKHIPTGSVANLDLPKKIFVLVTSGYLLQYAEKGCSDRLPEKALHLGRDSAAFACDLVPGKHYVLQVSQVVNKQGIIVASSGSIFSRLALRSASAKRMTNNFVLVLPNASEMESWMSAIRQEIQVLGGEKSRAEMTRADLKDGDPSASALRKTPSHRYEIKRNPSKVTPAASPQPAHTSFLHIPMLGDQDKSETSTLEGFDLWAMKFDDDQNSNQLSDRPTSSPSSPPFFVEPLQVSTAKETSIGSTHALRPESHSNKSSQSDEIPSLDLPASPLKSSPAELETPANKAVPSESPAASDPRGPAHHTSRKAAPAPLVLHSQALLPIQPSLVEESPIIQTCPAIPARSSRRPARASEGNSRVMVNEESKHDSKISSLPPLSVLDAIGSEDADTVGSLPTPPTVAPSRIGSPNGFVAKQNPLPPHADSNKARRVGSFSMPLRVNPSATHGSLASGNPRRHSRMDEPGRRISESVGVALTPPTDQITAAPTSYFNPAPSPPQSEAHQKSSPGRPSSRLSLFPNPTASPNVTPPEAPHRTSSVASRQSPPQPVLNGGSLRRPISMHVRSDHTPFLSSVRNSTGPSDFIGTASTVPIRSMKPSRSTGNLQSLPQRQSSLEALRALKFDTPPLAEEEEQDGSVPTVEESPTSQTTRSTSRSSVRHSLKPPHSSLSSLDFGIPALGLGPPLPPPRAPLPPPPTSSEGGSPPQGHRRTRSIDRVAGLGISVS